MDKKEISEMKSRIKNLENESRELNSYIVSLYKIFNPDSTATKAFDCLGLLYLVTEANKAWISANPPKETS